jgi:N-acetylglucosamine kinase-like BadF-type ATPase
MVLSSELYLGLLGATRKSVVAVVNEQGKILASHEAGPLAFRVNANLRMDLESAISEVASQLSFNTVSDLASSIRGACIAMSGIFQALDEFAVRQIFDSVFPAKVRVVVCEDVWTDLAAVGLNHGGVISAGSGTNVFFRNNLGDRFINVGCWGSEIDDPGSGYSIGRLVLSKLLQHADGRIVLSHRFVSTILDELRIRDPVQVTSWYQAVRASDFWRAKISDIAKRICQIAYEDEIAHEVIVEAVESFKPSILTGLKRCQDSNLIDLAKSTILLTGGLLTNPSLYRSSIEQFVESLATENNLSFNFSSVPRIVGSLSIAISGSMILQDKFLSERIYASWREVDSNNAK